MLFYSLVPSFCFISRIQARYGTEWAPLRGQACNTPVEIVLQPGQFISKSLYRSLSCGYNTTFKTLNHTTNSLLAFGWVGLELNRNVLFQTHLLSVTIYGIMWRFLIWDDLALLEVAYYRHSLLSTNVFFHKSNNTPWDKRVFSSTAKTQLIGKAIIKFN